MTLSTLDNSSLPIGRKMEDMPAMLVEIKATSVVLVDPFDNPVARKKSSTIASKGTPMIVLRRSIDPFTNERHQCYLQLIVPSWNGSHRVGNHMDVCGPVALY